MPTYEFVCPQGHHFDKFFRRMSSAASELPCPECGAIAERQISGGAGLLFKGSGFYITDYGKDGKKGMTPPPSSSHSTNGGTSTSSGSTGAHGRDAGTSSASSSKSSSAKADGGTKSE